VEKIKIFTPPWESKPRFLGCPSIILVTILIDVSGFHLCTSSFLCLKKTPIRLQPGDGLVCFYHYIDVVSFWRPWNHDCNRRRVWYQDCDFVGLPRLLFCWIHGVLPSHIYSEIEKKLKIWYLNILVVERRGIGNFCTLSVNVCSKLAGRSMGTRCTLRPR